ncbi:MAG: hypothetical protein IJW40_05075 [Clostridia bacterium]|nr:hypothetical protein [Clostridia bacterium]
MTEQTNQKISTPAATEQPTPQPAPTQKKKRRRRLGDRKDGRKVRTAPAMTKFMPYIMERRSDACNTFSDSLEISAADRYCRQKVREGKTGFSMLHLFLAAYVRLISQYPAVNRFVSGQKIYARNEIVFVMTIKKDMRLDSEDTCIKVKFDPTDTADIVYEKFNAVVEANKADENSKSSFDVLNKVLAMIPGLLCRWTVKLLTFMDYFGWLPRFLTDLSPFHGSMIITSMGSLGIRPIYHHIYDFGNLPVFLSYGTKYFRTVTGPNGETIKKKYIDLKVVTDERICDGYYYATAFKALKKIFDDPTVLDTPPAEVKEDID